MDDKKNNVIELGAWRKKASEQEAGVKQLQPGDEWLVPMDAHPDPAIRLAVEITKFLRVNRHTANPVEMLIALSLAYTGVVHTYTLQYGEKESARLTAEAEKRAKMYQLVFRRE